MLDEPTASLPADEVERLFDGDAARCKARGVGMIYVSHRLDEIFRIADRVVVLRDGALVGERADRRDHPRRAGAADRRRARRSTLFAQGRARRPARSALALARPAHRRRPAPSTSTSASGELLGLVGLRGAGQEEIGRALFGAAPHRRRDPARRRGAGPLLAPRRAIAPGIGLVARDRTRGVRRRRRSACARTLSSIPAPPGRGLFACAVAAPRGRSRRRQARRARSACGPTIPISPIEALSGGNQQKVVVGRWLATGRKLLVAEDPTAGVDVGAKAEIYRLIAARARAEASRSSSSPPTSRRSPISATARSSSTAAGSSPRSPATA